MAATKKASKSSKSRKAETNKTGSSGRKSSSGKRDSSKDSGKDKAVHKGVRDNIWGVCLIALGIFLFAAIEFEAAGEIGNMLGDFLKGIFGFVAHVLPFYLLALGALLFLNRNAHVSWLTFILSVVVLLMFCLINSGRFIDGENIRYAAGDFYESGVTLESGGLFGMMLGSALVKFTGKVGLYIISVVVILVCILIVINRPVSAAVDKITDGAQKAKERREEREEELASLETENRAENSQLTIEGLMSNPYDIKQYEKPEKKSRLKNILRYMKDDRLFEKDMTAFDSDKAMSPGNGEDAGEVSGTQEAEALEPEISYGLDGTKAEVVPGYGLDGGDERASDGYGLEGNIFPDNIGISGYGLDGDVVYPSSEERDEETGLPPEQEASKDDKPAKRNLSQAELTELMPEVDTAPKKKKYRMPPLDLLKPAAGGKDPHLAADLKAMAAKLEETLKNFNVDARVIQVTRGPAVTRYEIQPGIGVKVSSIARLSDDIALNLEAKSIRIEAPIPGKAAVGIEVENDKINMVTLREIIGSQEFKRAESKITFAVGKDIAGKAVVADLKSMPHLLIAGSTGSGKSVCINSIITSILYKANPDEVKLVLIDPKVVELGNYNGIPHLLIPVVTEPTKAAAALNWAVAEMTDRYKKFAENNVRDLAGYNKHMLAAGDADSVMPQIVIIIDELADLMMAAPSQVEESICRLAQMARAAGMHLIVATQRPSVDIITGVIKANIPSRIAFAVSSQFDSRTILDMSGAEKLVGKGDMLFNPLGMGKPVRVQGCFISDEEVSAVIDFIKSQSEDEPEYADDVMNTIEKGGPSDGGKDDDGDELLPEAIDCVVHAGQASVSMLQRRFRIGYNRAARIVEMMEERGIVGPQDGSRPRQVLLTEEELNAMKEEALE